MLEPVDVKRSLSPTSTRAASGQTGSASIRSGCPAQVFSASNQGSSQPKPSVGLTDEGVVQLEEWDIADWRAADAEHLALDNGEAGLALREAVARDAVAVRPSLQPVLLARRLVPVPGRLDALELRWFQGVFDHHET